MQATANGIPIPLTGSLVITVQVDPAGEVMLPITLQAAGGTLEVFRSRISINGPIVFHPFREESSMNLFAILSEVLLLLAQYGPSAVGIYQKVLTFIHNKDWVGLVAYLENLLAHPPVPTPAGLSAKVAELKAAMGDSESA